MERLAECDLVKLLENGLSLQPPAVKNLLRGKMGSKWGQSRFSPFSPRGSAFDPRKIDSDPILTKRVYRRGPERVKPAR